ncbi:hypothetical protein DPMN_095407 [Dreissena polymorpha]|uniref:Uncharacterized protein n=1 Tax=Dreissena polymorpha TaxID=45954 RepID=A0A9D4R2P9_DREPO|nr:hypothetical protein DPMN_095407 [Dreissena polymorpha]
MKTCQLPEHVHYQIDNLPKPHGNCDWKELRHTDYYTSDECYLDCLMTLAEDRCGCRDVYMPRVNGQIKQAFDFSSLACASNVPANILFNV